MVSSLVLLSMVVATMAAPRFEAASESYIAQALGNQRMEMEISSLMRNPPKAYQNLPPIIHMPTKHERTLKDGDLPHYVIDYAPLVHLYSEEAYLPYDIKKYVTNFHARYGNGTIVEGTDKDFNLTSVANLPKIPDIFLTANTDFDSDPEWITGYKNRPDLINGEIKDAPATLIMVDKGNGWVDAFWFYFYSFNLGPFVMEHGPFGNHVGDWEHSLVRFYNGKPVIVWMSAHGGGGAYYYHNLEKYSLEPNHPVIFSARGTHANYVSVGQHPHDLPYAILSDFTDRGPLWNPTKNYLGYTYDGDFVTPVTNNSNSKHVGREITYDNWLSFPGHWGDAQIPDDDPRQKNSLIGGYKYIDGPTGPLTKNLLRLATCERNKWWNFWKGCHVRENIKWGIGVESEGYNCGAVFSSIRPAFLRKILQRLTWGGGFCFVVDFFYG